MSMRRHTLFILGAISIASIVLYIRIVNPYGIQALWTYITQRPPIEWNGLTIDYKYGMDVMEYGDWIAIQYLGKGNEESLRVQLMGKQSIEQFKSRSYNGTGFTFISDRIAKQYGHEIYVLTIKKDDNNRYMVIYHVIDLDIAIGYAGPQERFSAYEEVIDSILYLNIKK